MPLVSVIVPSYNGRHLLPRTVESLLTLVVPEGGLEILIIDDGSTDGSREWLQQQSLPPRFRVLFHERNQGRSQARNTGIDQASGRIILFLDGDLTCSRDLITHHLAAIDRPGVVAVSGSVRAASDVPRTRVTRYLHESTLRGARQFSDDDPVPFQYLLTNNMSIRRSILDSGIRFSDIFDGYGGEDTLFAWHVEQYQPGGIRFAPEAVATDHDNQQLDVLLQKFGHYGRVNLPRLIERIPHEAHALRANWVLGPGLRPRVGRWLFSRPVQQFMRLLWPVTPFPVSNLAIRYLLAATVMDEFRRSLRARTTELHPGGTSWPAAPSRQRAA